MSTLNPKHHIEHERADTAVNLSFPLRASQASGAPIEYPSFLLPDRSDFYLSLTAMLPAHMTIA